MGYTYKVPENFKSRVIQYMRQLASTPDFSSAFERCDVEFEDLGNAYYAGMKPSPWDSNALDVTLFGTSECVESLERNRGFLLEAINKALRTAETGFILHKLFIVENELPGGSRFASNDDRLNADLESSRCVMNDIVRVGERLSANAYYTNETPEDSINDWVRDALSLVGYSEAKDQTRHGLSASGSSSGEVDILLCKDGHEVAILEGLKLTSVDKSYIDSHINKASINYNPLGTAVFVVAYVSSAEFGLFWERCFEYLRKRDYRLQVKVPITVEPYQNAAIRVTSMILSRDGYDFPLYFVAIKLLA